MPLQGVRLVKHGIRLYVDCMGCRHRLLIPHSGSVQYLDHTQKDLILQTLSGVQPECTKWKQGIDKDLAGTPQSRIEEIGRFLPAVIQGFDPDIVDTWFRTVK